MDFISRFLARIEILVDAHGSAAMSISIGLVILFFACKEYRQTTSSRKVTIVVAIAAGFAFIIMGYTKWR